MKIGVIVESFRQDLNDALVSAAKVGAQGVQIYAVCHRHNLLEFSKEQRAELKKLCSDNGLVVSAICGDLGGHGFQDEAGNPKRVELSKQIIDLCLDLGTKIMTTHIGVVPTRRESPIYQTMLKAMREVAEYAASKGAYVAIETGPETPDILNNFIVDVGSKGVAVNLDPANLVMVLRADPAYAVRKLAKYIVHTHAKDGVNYRPCNPANVYKSMDTYDLSPPGEKEPGRDFQEVPLGKGQVNWDEYFAALREINYNGFLTIEREVGDNPAADIQMAVEFLRARINK